MIPTAGCRGTCHGDVKDGENGCPCCWVDQQIGLWKGFSPGAFGEPIGRLAFGATVSLTPLDRFRPTVALG